MVRTPLPAARRRSLSSSQPSRLLSSLLTVLGLASLGACTPEPSEEVSGGDSEARAAREPTEAGAGDGSPSAPGAGRRDAGQAAHARAANDRARRSGAFAERADERARMVDRQLRRYGIEDEAVLAAMGVVPRHRFVPAGRREHAYADGALAIGHEQTISQPFIVAHMTQAARVGPDDRVLEVGTGSGYQAAVLAELTPHVWSIEIVEPLARRARETLDALGYDEVVTRVGDGYAGWPEHAPFDAVVVTAAPGHVPQPLVDQLAVGGRLVIPVGPRLRGQELLVLEKQADGSVTRSEIGGVRFVPMTGEAERIDAGEG